MFWLKLPANSVSKTLVKSKLDNYPLNSGSVTRNRSALVVLQRQLGLCVLVGKLVPFADLRFFMIEDWPWSKSGLIRPQSGWFSNYEVICKVKGAIYVGRIKHLCKTMAFTFDHHQNFEIADLDSVETQNKGLPTFWKICQIRDFSRLLLGQTNQKCMKLLSILLPIRLSFWLFSKAEFPHFAKIFLVFNSKFLGRWQIRQALFWSYFTSNNFRKLIILLQNTTKSTYRLLYNHG